MSGAIGTERLQHIIERLKRSIGLRAARAALFFWFLSLDFCKSTHLRIGHQSSTSLEPYPDEPMTQETHQSASSIFASSVLGKCPRCNKGKMFNGFLDLAPQCEVCGLDYKFADAGDGPAVFVMLFAGFLIVGLALWVEMKYEPPIWLHLVIFLPLTLIVCLGLFRPLKGLLVSLQYKNKAEQGRLEL
jgi:uncharacterized protein (DUF983 family)